MPIDIDRLEGVRRLSGGKVIARCPACAETGGDKTKKNHLVVWPDGRFGCVACPGDSAHRKRIFALVGQKQERHWRPGQGTVAVIMRKLARVGRSGKLVPEVAP